MFVVSVSAQCLSIPVVTHHLPARCLQMRRSDQGESLLLSGENLINGCKVSLLEEYLERGVPRPCTDGGVVQSHPEGGGRRLLRPAGPAQLLPGRRGLQHGLAQCHRSRGRSRGRACYLRGQERPGQ